MDKKAKLNILGQYTLLFIAGVLLCFGIGIARGYTFVWNQDGIAQHLTALTYYGQYIREIFSNIANGVHTLPEWSFSLGEGGDIVSLLHYYVIGDPFAALSFVCPSDYTYIYFAVALILRIYCAGLAFIWFMKSSDSPVKFEGSNVAVLIGSMVYVFADWTLLNIYRHPYFLNPIIYLPLLLLGAEKVIKRKSPKLFILTVMIAGLSNFYFFYMLVIMTVVYVAARLLQLYIKKPSGMIQPLLKLLVYAVIGVLMAMVIILPVLVVFLSDDRLTSGQAFALFYDPEYYMELPSKLLEGSEAKYACLGFGGIGVVSIVLLVMEKGKHLLLKVFSVLSVLSLVFAFVGKFFNGNSYATNRWTFAAALIAGVIVAAEWERLTAITLKQLIAVAATLGVLAALCAVFPESRKLYAFVGLAIGAVIAVIPFALKKVNPKVVCASIIVLVMANIGLNGYANLYHYTHNAYDQLDVTLVTPAGINAYYNGSDASAVKAAGADITSRYSATNVIRNAGLLNGLSTTQYYWTNSNSKVSEFRTLAGIDEYRLFWYNGYGRDAGLLSLSGVKYYAINDGVNPATALPFGYEYVSGSNGYGVYENKNALPLIYAYKQEMTKTEWAYHLNEVEKRDALLTTAVIEDGDVVHCVSPDTSDVTKNNLTFLNLAGDIQINGNTFTVLRDNAQVMVQVSGDSVNSENYLLLNGIKYTPDKSIVNVDENITFVMTVGGDIKSFEYYYKTYNWFNGRDNFAVDLGYSEEPVKSMTIMFPYKGVYSFDDIGLYSVSRESFAEDIDALRVEGADSINISEDTVTADITMDEDGIAVIAIPYSEGWRATVDGQEAKVLNANIQYMGIRLPAGTHHIELEYHNPFINIGAMISVLGVIMFAVVVIVDKKKIGVK